VLFRGGGFGTRIDRDFRRQRSRPDSHFLDISGYFGGLDASTFGFFKKRPRKGPQNPPAAYELPRTLPDDKPRLFHAFSRVFADFIALAVRQRTSPEVSGFGTAGHHIEPISL
jgi:hypothetical protein